MVQSQEWKTALRTAHKSELLAVSALEQLVTTMQSRDPRQVLSTSLDVHTKHAELLASLLDSSQTEDVTIPVRLGTMLAKKNVPERMLFAWLHEFESRLLEHYEETIATCREAEQKQMFEKLVAEQQNLVETTWDVTQRLTAVIDPAFWDDLAETTTSGGHDGTSES
ncbi:MAG TPA: ferritin-like domain-containing protein [Planktothrix sp.]|jgi:rubrerythrin